ncbi:MAG: hypothetical protein MI919_22990 [Holophagales bacterium]|nr:hypothetical protein [Holophagales bacterium]
MIVWSGWGILVPILVFLVLIATQLVTEALFGKGSYGASEHAQAIAFAVSAVLVGLVGTYMNRKIRIEIDEVTGDGFNVQSRHSFFFIPFQYWGLIVLALGLTLAYGT